MIHCNIIMLSFRCFNIDHLPLSSSLDSVSIVNRIIMHKSSDKYFEGVKETLIDLVASLYSAGVVILMTAIFYGPF